MDDLTDTIDLSYLNDAERRSMKKAERRATIAIWILGSLIFITLVLAIVIMTRLYEKI